LIKSDMLYMLSFLFEINAVVCIKYSIKFIQTKVNQTFIHFK